MNQFQESMINITRNILKKKKKEEIIIKNLYINFIKVKVSNRNRKDKF